MDLVSGQCNDDIGKWENVPIVTVLFVTLSYFISKLSRV